MNTEQQTLLRSIATGVIGRWELASLTYSAELARRALVKSGHIVMQRNGDALLTDAGRLADGAILVEVK